MDEIQKIVFEISNRCQRRKIPTTDMLAAFMAKAVILENPEQYQLDKALSQDDVEELVDAAVERLAAQDDPSLETLRMQVAFDSAYVQHQEALEKTRSASKRAYSLVEQSICMVKLAGPKDVGSMGQLHRLIIAALLTKTGQSPQHEVYQKEVAAALESVLPRANLHAFALLEYADKRDRLLDLHNYVLGIRLFNKAIGKGGAGLSDKVKDARMSVHNLKQTIAEHVQEAQQEVDDYSRVVTYVHGLAEKDDSLDEVLRRIKDEMNNRRQYLSFVQSFEEEIRSSDSLVSELQAESDAEMEELRDLVGRRSAVPKEKVYPLFEGLAKRWMDAQEVDMHVATLQRIFEELAAFRRPAFNKAAHQFLPRAGAASAGAGGRGGSGGGGGGGDGVSGGGDGSGEGRDGEGGGGGESPPPATDEAVAAALGLGGGGADEAAAARPVHVFRTENPEVAAIRMELDGYCPVTIATRDGLLLPADTGHGQVLYRGKLYGFVSISALRAFMKDPSKYLDGVLAAARKKPELINMLGLDGHFPHNVLRRYLTHLGGGYRPGSGPDGAGGPAETADSGCQTVMHPMERHIDPQYEWNEWSLRRRALQLANLHTKRTHSTQTNQSAFRRENETQVYLPKAGVTQTATERGTRPVKHLQYLSGLRGHPDQETGTVRVDIDLQ